MKRRRSTFKGFRRKAWFVGDPWRRGTHEAAIKAWEALPWSDAPHPGPLTRTWREGEPLIVTKYRSVRV